MDLSAELFQQIVAAIGEPQPGERPEELRRARRVSHRCSLDITLLPDEHDANKTGDAARPRGHMRMAMRNLSSRGVSLLSRERLSPGRQFVLSLPHQSGHTTQLLCTIMHSTPLPNGLHTIGAEFTCVLNAPPTAPDPIAGQAERERIRARMMV